MTAVPTTAQLLAEFDLPTSPTTPMGIAAEAAAARLAQALSDRVDARLATAARLADAQHGRPCDITVEAAQLTRLDARIDGYRQAMFSLRFVVRLTREQAATAARIEAQEAQAAEPTPHGAAALASAQLDEWAARRAAHPGGAL